MWGAKTWVEKRVSEHMPVCGLMRMLINAYFLFVCFDCWERRCAAEMWNNFQAEKLLTFCPNFFDAYGMFCRSHCDFRASDRPARHQRHHSCSGMQRHSRLQSQRQVSPCLWISICTNTRLLLRWNLTVTTSPEKLHLLGVCVSVKVPSRCLDVEGQLGLSSKKASFCSLNMLYLTVFIVCLQLPMGSRRHRRPAQQWRPCVCPPRLAHNWPDMVRWHRWLHLHCDVSSRQRFPHGAPWSHVSRFCVTVDHKKQSNGWLTASQKIKWNYTFCLVMKM